MHDHMFRNIILSSFHYQIQAYGIFEQTIDVRSCEPLKQGYIGYTKQKKKAKSFSYCLIPYM